MKIFSYVLLVLLALLSLVAGIAKLIQTPAEIEFFASAGLDAVWLYPLGAVQVAGAIMAAIPRTRTLGTLSIALGFAISSLVIFMTGNTTFGLVSLVTVALTILAWKLVPRAG